MRFYNFFIILMIYSIYKFSMVIHYLLLLRRHHHKWLPDLSIKVGRGVTTMFQFRDLLPKSLSFCFRQTDFRALIFSDKLLGF